MLLHGLFFIFGLFIVLLPSTSYTLSLDEPAVQSFIDDMLRKKEKPAYTREELVKILSAISPRENVLEIMSRPAEKSKKWADYRDIFLTNKRIAGGVVFFRKNRKALKRAEQQFGVPSEMIAAIIGVETFYGRRTGEYRVVDALGTLSLYKGGFAGRSSFFRKELEHFLLFSKEYGVDPLSLTGSYAGAMGIPQFISSSYRVYAIDFNGDQYPDIWNNMDDAIGSVANYFYKHKWRVNQPVAFRAKIASESLIQSIAQHRSFETKHRFGDLSKQGVSIDHALASDTKVGLLVLEGKAGKEHWVILDNFSVIGRYNHSVLYAMAVFQLAQEIRQRQNTR